MDWDNVGVATADAAKQAGKWWPFWNEGSAPMHALSKVPGVNSFALLHDYWMRSLSSGGMGGLTNFPSMIPTFAINYAALMDGVAPQILIGVKASKSR